LWWHWRETLPLSQKPQPSKIEDWGTPTPSSKAGPPAIYDFNVWSRKKRVEKLHYMHMNPVKRKLVAHRKDWSWSSFSFYSNLKSGLIRVDPVN
jgi:hypothetical protein